MTAPAILPRRVGRPRLTADTPYPCGHPRTPENRSGGGCRTCRVAVNARHYRVRTTRHLTVRPPSSRLSPAVVAAIEACRPAYCAAVAELSGQLSLELIFARRDR